MLSELIVDFRIFRGFGIEAGHLMLVAPARIQQRRYKKKKIRIMNFDIK